MCECAFNKLVSWMSAVTACVILPDVKQKCVKFTTAAVISLLLLLLLAGILLGYYCECWLNPLTLFMCYYSFQVNF